MFILSFINKTSSTPDIPTPEPPVIYPEEVVLIVEGAEKEGANGGYYCINDINTTSDTGPTFKNDNNWIITLASGMGKDYFVLVNDNENNYTIEYAMQNGYLGANSSMDPLSPEYADWNGEITVRRNVSNLTFMPEFDPTNVFPLKDYNVEITFGENLYAKTGLRRVIYTNNWTQGPDFIEFYWPEPEFESNASTYFLRFSDKKWSINHPDNGPVAYTKNLDIVNNSTWTLTDYNYQNLGSINVYVRFIKK